MIQNQEFTLRDVVCEKRKKEGAIRVADTKIQQAAHMEPVRALELPS